MAWTEFRKTNAGTARKFNKKKGVWETGAWYVYERINGKRVSKPAGSIWKTAKDIKRRVENDKAKRKDGTLASPAIGTAYGEYEIQVKKILEPNTWKAYNWGLEKLLEFFEPSRTVDSITKPEILKFRARIMQAHSTNGMLGIMKYVRTFFSFCVDMGYVEINPCRRATKGIKETPVFKYLNSEEISHIIAICKRSKFSQMRDEFPLIVKFTLLCGLREEEVASIKWMNIRGDVMNVLGKGNKMRPVPISPKLAPILGQIKDKFADGDNIFNSWSAGRIRQAWGRIIKRAKKEIPNLGRVRFHDLRHTFATDFLHDGGNLMDLKNILGHESITTTARYTHSDIKHLSKAMDQMKAEFLDALPPEFRIVR